MYHNISFGGHINNTLIKVGEKQNANTNDRTNLRDIDLIAYSIQFFYCGRTRFAALILDSRCNSLRRLSHSLSWTWICLTLGFPSKTCPCRCASILTHIHIIVNVRKYIYIFCKRTLKEERWTLNPSQNDFNYLPLLQRSTMSYVLIIL